MKYDSSLFLVQKYQQDILQLFAMLNACDFLALTC